MKENPLVSICLPIYNRPEYLKKSLGSIVFQSYQNMEIIISDDCSPDRRVEEVVNEFKKNDNRIRFFKQERNIGCYSNYIFVLEQVLGKYTLLAMDDDMWDREYIAEGVNLLENNNNYDVWNSSVYNIDSYDRVIKVFPQSDRFTTKKYFSFPLLKYTFEPEQLGKFFIFHSIYRTKILIQFMDEYCFYTPEEPWRDYVFCALVLSKVNFYGSKKYLYFVRTISESDKKDGSKQTIVKIKKHWGGSFEIKWAKAYIIEHYKVLKGHKYRLIVPFLLIVRLIIFIIYKMNQNIKGSYHSKKFFHHLRSFELIKSLFHLKRLLITILQ